MSKGVLLYAHNNNEIDYFKIACANAKMIKYNLNVPVTIVTDSGTYEYEVETLSDTFLKDTFDKIIVVDKDHKFSNMRNFHDTSYLSKSLEFYNANHWEAFDHSPYDETLFIDADYFIMSDALNKCWDSKNDVMINSQLLSATDNRNAYSEKIDDFGIKLYWATVIYFKKTDFAKFLFALVKHVQENYNFYRELYTFKSSMFRNDYAFSVAVHMLNGFTTETPIVGELPISGLMMAWDSSDIQQITGINDITLFCEKSNEKGVFTLTRLKEQDIHILNKWSASRVTDRIIELYGR